MAQRMFGRDIAVANKTVTERQTNQGMEKLSALKISNQIKLDAHASAFEYNRGEFIPMTGRTQEEIRQEFKFFSPQHLKELTKRHFTMFYEDRYALMNNDDEGIPLIGLGNHFQSSNLDYSSDVEHIFMSFTKHHIFKDHLDDVYSFGLGLQEIMKFKDRNSKDPIMQNAADYIQVAMDSQIRGRKYMRNARNFKGSSGIFIKEEFGTTYKIDWVKLVRSFKHLASAPIMWLKPIQGVTNGIFAYLYKAKEAVKGSINDTEFFGTDGELTGFTTTDLL